jgi:deferrochelatase/peroxidase EfeB
VTTPSTVDYDDVQGIVRYGHGKLTRACFYLLQVQDAAAARTWLLTAPVTTAVARKPLPTSALQVAFTSRGLHALGVPEEVTQSFSPEFVAGMAADPNRSRRLGDLGVNAPMHWRWGAGEHTPDVLVMLFATAETWPSIEATTMRPEWRQAFHTIASLHAADLDRNEPFGFADGLSQPDVDWAQSRVVRKSEPHYTNLSALGEFVLGYPNEYERFTGRPLLDASAGEDLPPAIDHPGKLDVGRHGTYLVFRELQQDVRRFWCYMRDQTGSLVEAQRLAEAMVGRTMNGEPLAVCGGHPIEGVERTPENDRLNRFVFDGDPHGERCPLGAHIRRANPRNNDFGGPVGGPVSQLMRHFGIGAKGWRDDRVAATRFHRILRRGRKFGPTLSPADAMESVPANEPERGLYFACLNANIGRQFEFVQNAWLMGGGFEGLTNERDPLLGIRTDAHGACDTFTIPAPDGASRRLYNLPDFVTVRGGAYFFLPGIRALRFLASAGRSR